MKPILEALQSTSQFHYITVLKRLYDLTADVESCVFGIVVKE